MVIENGQFPQKYSWHTRLYIIVPRNTPQVFVSARKEQKWAKNKLKNGKKFL